MDQTNRRMTITLLCASVFVSFMMGRESAFYIGTTNVERVVENISQDVVDAEVVKVYDGDTITVNIAGWPDIIGKKIEIRINGIDAPELHDKRPHIREKAVLATNFLNEKIGQAKFVQLKHLHRDKYFRIDADVFVNGVDVGKELLNNGFAIEYDGKTKKNWE